MKRIEDNELRMIQLNILEYINSVCRSNNIMYSLAYGTLIGAIRHKGYIPWDDDVDILMTRDNFEKFLLVQMTHPNERYKLLWIDSDPNYTLPLPKMVDTNTVLSQTLMDEKTPISVYVDVFIFDNIPDDEKKREMFFKRLDLVQRFWGYSQMKYIKRTNNAKEPLKRLLFWAFHRIDPRIFVNRLNIIAKRYENAPSKNCGTMTYSSNRFIEYYRKEYFDNYVEVLFEGKSYLICEHYDKYLTERYGNYMMLPPVEKQKSHHDFLAFYRDID